MLSRRALMMSACTAGLLLPAAPALADGTYGPGGYGDVSLLPTGALLGVGTLPYVPPVDASRAVGPAAAVGVGGSAPVPEQAAAGSANVGAGAGSGVGCVSALSDIPQTQPGGAYYDFHCLGAAAGGGANRQSQGTVWIPNQVARTGRLPAAPAPAPVPLPPPAAVLAREAADQLLLPAPNVEVSPHADHDQVVDFPTWLWLGAGSFAARSRTVTVPGESVTATAVPVSVSWTMGDGSTVTCAGPGTPTPRPPHRCPGPRTVATPTCGHRSVSRAAATRSR